MLLGFVSASQCVAEPDWSATAIAGIAKEHSPSLALEADFTYVPDMFPDAPPLISAKLSVVNLTGTVLYDLGIGDWQSYLAVGAGLGRTRFTQTEFAGNVQNPPHWGPAVNAGAGVKRRLTAHTELRADVRYILIRDIPDA